MDERGNLEMSRKNVLLLVLMSSLSIALVTSVIIDWKSKYAPDLFGMHEAVTWRYLSKEKLNISRTFEILQSLGVRKIREPIWRRYMNDSTTIKTEAKNAIKYVIQNASLFGIEIMGYVQDFPPWMTGFEGDNKTVPHRNVTVGSDYRRFLKVYEESWETLAREFPEIEVWEIGNEYNLPEFLHPPEYNETDSKTWFIDQERVDIVTDLLYYGSRGITASNPKATRVMCGLGPTENSIYRNGIYDIRDFLNAIYGNIESGKWPSTSADDFFHVVCWHPYTFNEKPTKEKWVDPNTAVYEVMKNHNHTCGVVFSEMGFSDNCTGLSKEEIADFLLETLRLAKDMPWLDTIYWFRLMDPDPAYDQNLDCREYGYGIIETPAEDWAWKPAAYAYESLTHPFPWWTLSVASGVSLLMVIAIFVLYLLRRQKMKRGASTY